MTELYWFRSDLRLDDNPGLYFHAGAASLLCVYLWPPQVPWCNVNGIGVHRLRFLHETVAQLQQALRERGQDLLVVRGSPSQVLPRLVEQFGVARMGVASAPGVYEHRDTDHLARALDIPVTVHEGNTLFAAADIAALPGGLPAHYTPFRQLTATLEPLPAGPEARLPAPPPGLKVAAMTAPAIPPHPAFVARGGAAAGQRRLHQWMHRERAIDTYRDSRNQLEGLFSSSALSPWLANGSLSVRRVAHELRLHERLHGENPSTAHFYRELLWREFFHWRALRDGHRLFSAHGVVGKRRLTTFEPRNFARWCAGRTNYPLVNALMHQLVATGWMSNRGRQIAASCLVNELRLDWRCGAAFFEKHLLDYDVASNYGNWQYIAGVGADPRGGRHFNLHKQVALYDPDGAFTRRWEGACAPQPEFVVDAADWPIA
ncbi:MAG: DASH family cryptochrome [Halioglobus sp.]